MNPGHITCLESMLDEGREINVPSWALTLSIDPRKLEQTIEELRQRRTTRIPPNALDDGFGSGK